jgi:tRNA-specific 2-thiouridylase
MEQITAIALSGGVDSSVAALLVRETRKRLIGATHFIWPNSRCCSLAVFKRAEYLARLLSIPYFVINVEAAFREKVVGNFIATYLAGMTPNPCVLCNEYIRFTLFYDELKQKLMQEKILSSEQELLFATGHYARMEKTDAGLFLKKARDPAKDQSYMLYRLPKNILPRLVFPLGDLLKKEVVEIARKNKLTVAEEKESQDACFVDGSYADFIVRETGRRDLREPGQIVDLEGMAHGEHRGFINYTVGQRRGLGLGDGPWYVTGIEPEKNMVIVGKRDEAMRRQFLVGNTNWFIEPPSIPLECAVKIRYQTNEIPARLLPDTSGRVRVVLQEPELVTPGQSSVFYSGDLVLGGGVIEIDANAKRSPN